VSEPRPAEAPPGPPDLPDAGLDPAGGWQRLHPLTPLVRGWKAVAALLVVVGQQRGDDLFRAGVPSRQEALITLGVLVGVAVIAVAYALLAWRRARYRVVGESLELQTGVLFRQERQARLDRLQAVDVVRPLLGRFLGLAELNLEVAGGRGSGVRLSLLREPEAQALRNTLLARAAGVAYEGEQAPQAPEQEVLSVPVGRSVEALLRSVLTLVLLLGLVAVVVVVVVTREAAILTGVVPILLGLVTTTWQRFTTTFGFRVATSPDGIRLHHGLLTTRSQTVPPGRVQAVRVRQPLLWRGRDWWQVEVNVAGYDGQGAGEQGQADENVLLTVGSRAEALLLLRLAVPALGPEDAGPVAAGLTGTGAEGGFVPAPRSSRWVDPVGWRRHGVQVLERALLLRRGVLARELDVVPHARTQSLALVQGPLQRRLGLVTFVVHSTRGPVTPTVEHLAADVAGRLLAEQAERARTARGASGDADHGRWMVGR
jgi:putative membrane protein